MCDKCGDTTKPTRKLRLSDEPYSGNLYLCRHCFVDEMRWRLERNKDLADFAKFDVYDLRPIKFDEDRHEAGLYEYGKPV